MRTRDLLEGVPVFLAVAEARSFTHAARKLGISPSAVSQAVRALEEKVGSPLLMRSTRSLSLTAAGAAYLERAGPAYATLAEATREVMGRSAKPAGPLRLVMPRAAFDGIVAPVLAGFRAAYPDVDVEIEVESRLVDIVELGFDAGLRYGDLLAKEVTAFEAFPASRSVLVAAPSYLEGRRRPEEPAGLLDHHGVVCRNRTTGLTVPWLLTSGHGVCRIDPSASMIAGDLVTMIDLTVQGHGISCAPVQSVERRLRSGDLVHLLPAWSVPLEPLHIYYPSRRGQTSALRAFVAYVRQVDTPVGPAEALARGRRHGGDGARAGRVSPG